MRPRLLTLCQKSWGKPDGIRDYTLRLVAALNYTNRIDADLLWRDDDGSWCTGREMGRCGHPDRDSYSLGSLLSKSDALLVQYNPFLYGRWGFAPWLPFVLWRMRCSRVRPRIALMVHEPFVPMINWRWRIMGVWQRLQLFVLRLSADIVFVSIEAWAQHLGNSNGEGPIYHLPVGSSLPDGRRFRKQQRELLGADEHTVVLATFGQNHPARLQRCVVESANALKEAGRRVILLNLGANAPPLTGLDDAVRAYSPGNLPADELARWLAAADVYLAPFVDGASTRRTTLMAAMQHGLPIVATDGPLTDSVLREAGALRLVPMQLLDQFPREVRMLVESPDARRFQGARARDQYVQCFDWPVTTSRLLSLLGMPASGASAIAVATASRTSQ